MSFDKIGGRVGYNDADHSYTNMDTGEKYISVTTLIGKFKPEFKTDYWSTYKAIKDILEDPKDWKPWWKYKKTAGGWANVPQHFTTDLGKVSLSEDQLFEIEIKKTYYVDKWQQDSDDACELGSGIHLELEEAAFHCQQIRHHKVNYQVSDKNILVLQDFSSNGVYPELLIHNDKFMVAGQADKVFKEGKYVDIHDYKTCKEITKEPFMEETLLSPFTGIPNANYWIYQIQLSMYGWMLEQLGYKVRNLYMHWIYGDDKESKVRNKVKTFELEYRPDIVKEMVEHHMPFAA